MRVYHQLGVVADAAPGRFDPLDGVRNSEVVLADDAHLRRVEPLLDVAAQFGFGLLARCPAATRVPLDVVAHGS